MEHQNSWIDFFFGALMVLVMCVICAFAEPHFQAHDYKVAGGEYYVQW